MILKLIFSKVPVEECKEMPHETCWEEPAYKCVDIPKKECGYLNVKVGGIDIDRLSEL